MRPVDVPPEAVEQVRRLHASVDTSARRLEVLHAERLQCRRGCSDCCVDDLTVSLSEAARIVRDEGALLASAAPAPRGACAMLAADGACRIYASRPYVCRTQGLPLRWIDDDERVERRDVCPKNDPPPSPLNPGLEDLPAAACWTLGAAERALAAIDELAGTSGARFGLRDLFDVAVLCASRGGEPPRGSPASAARSRRR